MPGIINISRHERIKYIGKTEKKNVLRYEKVLGLTPNQIPEFSQLSQIKVYLMAIISYVDMVLQQTVQRLKPIFQKQT